MSIQRTWRTLRHLKAGQVLSRVALGARAWLEDREGFFTRQVPPMPRLAPPFRRELPASGAGVGNLAALQAGQFTFLNETRPVGFPPDWSARSASKLWRYNLHYFDYLWQLDFRSARRLVLDWIADYPLTRCDADGWEPYPTSVRLINWIGVLLGRFRLACLEEEDLLQTLWRSCWLQGQWLCRHVETHLRGNHLLENAAALVLLGRTFTGKTARAWWRRGAGMLAAQLDEQILPDGVHFERSPMYQSRVVWLLLALSAAGCGPLDPRIHAAAVQLTRTLGRMSHPDGQIALLNDAAMGIYPSPQQLSAEAARLGLGDAAALAPPTGAFALPQAGYYGHRNDRGDYLICDAGPVGPDYIPGHAHGDVFSFELSLGARRVIVDSGVHDYQVGPMRDYCRSTRAHNTVEIARQDQCEFWKAFRVGRRPRIEDVRFQPAADGFALSGRHDGYRSLPGSPVHKRSIAYQAGGVLVIRDQVRASTPVAWCSRLHLAPDCRVTSTVGSTARIQTPSGPMCIRFAGPGELRVKPGQYCPQFGQILENPVLEYRTAGTNCQVVSCLARAAGEGTQGIPETPAQKAA
jgi:uncharacterized heparinase superfamily protein